MDLTDKSFRQLPSSFFGDLAESARAWKVQPLIPLISLGLGLAGPLSRVLGAIATGQDLSCLTLRQLTSACRMESSQAGLTSLVQMAFLPLIIFAIGWVGTERVWYSRAFRAERLQLKEAWRLTWRFLGRYAALGILVFLPLVILVIIVYFLNPSTMRLMFVIGIVPIDILLTFVTPALAFSTSKVSEALRIGVRMITQAWPGTAPYVLIPPLAITLIVQLSPLGMFGIAGLFGITGLTVLLNLLFKGAVAAYYLRESPGTEWQEVP